MQQISNQVMPGPNDELPIKEMHFNANSETKYAAVSASIPFITSKNNNNNNNDKTNISFTIVVMKKNKSVE